MLLSFEELCRKEVIDIATGERLGFIDDIKVDIESGNVESLVIYGCVRLFGLFGRENDTVISCKDIKVVGEDVVLVQRDNSAERAQSTKYQKNSFLSLLK
ncbi:MULTISPECIES: YlmC/YmxH family sporulation protein [Ruminococcus]|jgi:YlmC/YmxH family sporulation protein|uniref:Sporulation protein, YlmC/YmxH family n=1 Tax=Ruminococcus flavefaciens TaxID=1265 RepID=A0A1M7KNW4_RUMFL|nr:MULTISPECIES: YlmC/YmxH family sporulation protein [Ruminococcus]MCR4793893.1 YlmC/YmxH family sporulation protein [Ruminococcus sp.]SHM67118.1 sporulation protein, YlmC/YmxH family [Ruminococcus flavefaciens]